MNFTINKPNLVDPNIIRKLKLLNKKTNSKYLIFGKKTYMYIVITIVSIIILYFVYNRYQSHQQKKLDEIKQLEKLNNTPQPTNYYQVAQVGNVPLKQPPVPHTPLRPSHDIQPNHVFNPPNQPTPQPPTNAFIQDNSPMPINFNPTQQFESSSCPRNSHQHDDYSLEARSYTNLNPVLVGNNFSQV